MTDYTIREARPEDLDRGLPETLSSLTRADAAKPVMATAFWARGKCEYRTFVAVVKQGEGDWVVGTASLFFEPKLTRDCRPAAHIEDVAVNSLHQGRGIGEALVRHCLAHARRMGCYKAILDCDETICLFYEKMGFYRNGVAMRADLE